MTRLDYLDRPSPTPKQAALAYDETSLWSARFGDLLLRHVPLLPREDILDLGCGTGFPLFELAAVHGPGCRCIGIDVWRAALARAAAKAGTSLVPRVWLVAGDAAALPFPDQRFSLVVSNLGVNNLADRGRAIEECARVLRPGGHIVLTTNLQGHLSDVYAAFRSVLQERMLPDALVRLDEEERHRIGEAALVMLLERCGFHIGRRVRETAILRYRDGSAFLRHPLTAWFLERWKAVVDEPRRPDVFAALEARLNATARREGELRFTVPMLYIDAVRAR